MTKRRLRSFAKLKGTGKMTRLHAIWVFLIALITLAFSSVEAGTIKVSPAKVVLTDDGQAQTIRLQNLHTKTSLVQIEAIDLTEVENLGEAQPNGAIRVVPSIFKLEPNGEQLVDLAFQEPNCSAAKKAFRLVITKVPKEVGPDGNAFAVRTNLPIFVTPTCMHSGTELLMQIGIE